MLVLFVLFLLLLCQSWLLFVCVAICAGAVRTVACDVDVTIAAVVCLCRCLCWRCLCGLCCCVNRCCCLFVLLLVPALSVWLFTVLLCQSLLLFVCVAVRAGVVCAVVSVVVVSIVVVVCLCCCL